MMTRTGAARLTPIIPLDPGGSFHFPEPAHERTGWFDLPVSRSTMLRPGTWPPGLPRRRSPLTLIRMTETSFPKTSPLRKAPCSSAP
jgi:hypothetical protein